MDPNQCAVVERIDAETVSNVASLLEQSTTMVQLVLREAELDALWSLADVAASSGDAQAEAARDQLWMIHEELGHGERAAALSGLRSLEGWLAT